MVPDMENYEKASKVLTYIMLSACVGFLGLILYVLCNG